MNWPKLQGIGTSRIEKDYASGKFSKLDQGIFYFYKGPEMIGIVVRFVDNLLWARTSTFYQVISKLRKIFHIESENQMISIISE